MADNSILKKYFNFPFSAGAVSVVTVINVFLAGIAFLKDLLAAAYLGTTVGADAFWLAFFLPDMIVNNILIIALNSSCVTVFSRIAADGQDWRIKRAARNIFRVFSIGSVLIFLLMLLLREELVGLLGGGLDKNSMLLCVSLYTIMLPAVLLSPVVGIGSALLHVNRRFTIPALAPVIYNLVFLAGILWIYIKRSEIMTGVYILAAAVLCGTFLMAVLIWVGIKLYVPDSQRQKEVTLADNGQVASTVLLFWPYALVLAITQAVFLVERHLGSSLEHGSVAAINYAFRVSQFPLWVFVSAVSIVTMPSMSRLAGLNKRNELNRIFSKALNMVLAVTAPVTIILFILRVPILTILFNRGAFNADSVELTARVLAGYSLGIVFQGFAALGLRACMAIGKMGIAILSFSVSAVVNIGLDFFLVRIYGISGLGYGMMLGSMVNAAIMMYMLYKNDVEVKTLASGTHFKANLAVIPVALVFLRLWDKTVSDWQLPGQVLYAIAAAVSVLAVYYSIMRVSRSVGMTSSDRGDKDGWF